MWKKENAMGLFEEQPLLLVPVIIVTVEVWSLIKAAALRYMTRRPELDAR